MTHLSSSDSSSSSNDGLSNQEIILDTIQDDIELNNDTISVNENVDDVVSGSDDGSLVTKVNNANMSCQYPSFYDTIMSQEHDTDAHKALLKEQIWITLSLKNEIIHRSPKDIDKIPSAKPTETHYKLSSFIAAAAKMFPKHREFVNSIQLKEVFEQFCGAWNFSVQHTGGIFKCSYCASKSRKKSLPAKRKLPLTSVLKNQFKCPCTMHYALIQYTSPTKNKIYYKVRITGYDFNHTHPLSNSFYKRSVFHSKSKRKVELKSFQNALELLRVEPRLSNCALRKLLYSQMPTDFLFSPDFSA